MSSCNNNKSKLTDDLLTKILKGLPLKSLLICKAVSKPWCSLISSPTFIKSYLAHSISTPGADETLIVQDFDGIFEPNNTISLLHLRAPQPQYPLQSPFSRHGQSHTKLVGCCNGIVCVSVPTCDVNEHSFKSFDECRPVTYLWNPATRMSKLIAPHTIHYDDMCQVVQGFGYDPVDDDFKIVRVVTYPFRVEVHEDVDEVDLEVRVNVEVYSSKWNSWRRLWEGCMPEEMIECQTENYDNCVDGVLCCINEGLPRVMAFDLNGEVFNCDVEFPVSSKLARIISMDDSAVGFITLEKLGGEIKLWKMNDVECLRGGGTEASWFLMLSINVNFGCIPHNYYNSGDLVLIVSGPVWVAFNTEKKEATNLPIKKFWRQIFRYTESLVSIPGFEQVMLSALHGEGIYEDESESQSEDEDEDQLEDFDDK